MTIQQQLRWTLLFGSFVGKERTMMCELQRGVQRYLPYVLQVRTATGACLNELEHVLLAGTVSSNSALAQVVSGLTHTVPTTPGSYLLHVGESPWRPGARVIAVAGADPAGALHGVAELLAWISEGGVPLDIPHGRRTRIDGLPNTTLTSTPAVAERGLWTWGYVIHDYRRYLDHMVRLRMNTLTIWNDVVPINMAEIIVYAHDRGIAVHAGFQWGWGIPNIDLSQANHREAIKQSVLRTYREQYADLPIDGLYFQTITEHTTQYIAGRSIASWCCDLINPIVHDLTLLRPDLPIQFGLHATSIGDNISELHELDPRLTITWEDAGALPFAVNPRPENHGSALSHDFPATLTYAKKLADWRPGSRFSMVPKGWLMLRWGVEFENHGSYICGERHPSALRERLAARQGEWDWCNQLWYRHYPLAAEFYRTMLDCAPGGLLATGLVEDGLFEEKIQPSVSLFAETLWNPRQSDTDILARALRPYTLGELSKHL